MDSRGLARDRIKKEFILEGLNCANCVPKIEARLTEIIGVNTVNINFVTKTLTVEITFPDNISNILGAIKQIVQELEPDVVVKEKAPDKMLNKVLLLQGLSCSSCAEKIQRNVNNIPDVEETNLDFVSGKLAIRANSSGALAAITTEAIKIIKALEPDVNVIDEQENKTKGTHIEQQDSTEKWYSKKTTRLLSAGVLFAVALVFKLPFLVDFSLFLVSYLLAGGEILLRAAKNISRGQVFDENFLMSIATLGAFAIGEFPEGVAVMLFFQTGEYFQALAVNRSRKSIADLMDIRPDFANLKVGDDTRRVPPEEVSIGDIIIIKPGEKVPLDGKVIEGLSMVDTTALTGESVPREVNRGDNVLSGFINVNGLLTVQVEKEFKESTVAKILNLVQNASAKKAPTENFITKFARYYTPVVVIAALSLAVIPPLVIDGATFSEWIYRALVFLIISCPCALVVSIPLGFFGGIGGASRSGVLVKGGNYLEALNEVDTVVFDKTGTLTKGVFKVTDIKPTGEFTNDELLEYAAVAESYSNHPIALSIFKAYGAEIAKEVIADYDEIPGHGIKVKVKGKQVLAGNIKLMVRENIAYAEVDTVGTVVHVAIDNKYAGYIIISDEVKEDSARAIKDLKAIGVKKIVMLTGDNKKVAAKIGTQLSLDEVHAELLPDQKVEQVEKLYSQKRTKGKLLFVGDGINDAPVLARADVGVAMGGLGSDAAIEAADIVLMTDEPSKLVTGIKIAKRTRSIVWQNIILALGVKGVFLVLGAFGIATLWEAVFADVGVTILAVLNAMRVLKISNI